MLCICHLAAAVSAEPPAADRVVRPQVPAEAGGDDSETLKQGGHNSISLSRRQIVIQCLDLAREAIDRADFLTAAPLLERVLSEPNSFIPVNPSLEVGAHEDARRLMGKLPADLRQRLNEPRTTAARRVWEQSRLRGTAEAAEFLQKFADLPLAVEVWWWLGCHERDHARHKMAQAAFTQVVSHPQASAVQRGVARLAVLESIVNASQIDTSQIDEALRISSKMTESELDQNLEVAGRPVRLADVLAELRQRLSLLPSANREQSDEIAASRSKRPALEPTWKLTLNTPLGTSLDVCEQKQREQGVRPVQIVRPLIAGDRVIIRTLDSIQAFQIGTGKALWAIHNVEFDRQWIDNDVYQAKATEWAQRRYSADSVFGRMSTDARSLYAIQEPDRWGEFRIDQGAPRGGGRTGPRFNKLCCYSLDSGAIKWEIGGDPLQLEHSLGGYFFLGSPLVMDDMLYVIAQRETEIQLLSIEPEKGLLAWSLPLGSALLPISDDLQRSRVACPIIWQNGLLICSTSAGAIVAVDPLLRTMLWSYRYPATTIAAGDLQRAPNHQDVYNGHEPWWDFWREPILLATSLRTASESGRSDGKQTSSPILVFASPETDQLHAIRLPKGDPLWRIPRDGGVTVAGIVKETVIVIEGDAVRGHAVSSGRQAWRIPTPEIGGPGAIVGKMLILPAQIGGTILLDVESGQLLATPAGTESEVFLGACVEAGESWILMSRRQLMRLPRLRDVRKQVADQLEREPDVAAVRIHAAALDLEAGEFTLARHRLEGLKTPSALTLRRRALIEALKSTDINGAASNRIELSRQLKEAATDSEDGFEIAFAIATAALSAGDLKAAVTVSLDGLSRDLDQPEPLIKNSSVNARKDRVLLGIIDAAVRKASPADRQAVDGLYRDRVNSARISRDRFALQSLVQQWRGFDWARHLVVLEEEKALRKRTPTEVELLLLDAAADSDRTIALRSLEKLASRFDRSGAPWNAAAVRQRIQREEAWDAFQTSGFTGLDQTPKPHASATVLVPQRSLWPEVDPIIESHDEKTFGVFSLVPSHAEPGSLLERLDIWVDRNGNELLFRGDGFFQSGQDDAHERRFKLPPSVSPFRGPVGYMLREAWGIGRIVIVLVGSELFGIAPLDDKGEPNSRFLWSNSIDLQGSPGDTRVVVAKTGVNEGRHLVIDQLNRQIGKVGPVRAGYLCYQRGTKLLAIETETGRPLWERLDIPPDAIVFGDDDQVFIWRENRALEILSAIDGRQIEQRVCDQSPAQMIHQRDSLVWTVHNDENSKLELRDLKTGRLIWTRTDPPEARVAVLDPETLVIARPEGKLVILSARTGQSFGDPLAVNTGSLTGMIIWSDIDRWTIALMQPGSNAALWKSLKPNECYRRQLVKGTMIAIDRRNPRVLWTRELHDEPVLLDQSRAAPVLIQAWKSPSRDNVSASDGILNVIDKRTGKTLVQRHKEDMSLYFLLNPDPQQSILELKLPRELIRLTYPQRDVD